ncbi:MAG TPA: HAMP domain-containing sensor histidine kinase [Roseiarcus sp.]|nr:HAMP domain-containing sensor histidine kinase [Roseiarcus sp.]
MMIAPRRFLPKILPKTAAGQLTSVVVAAVLIGVGLSSAVMFYLVYSGGIGPSHETRVQVRAARIAAVVNGVLEARSLDESTYITKHASGEPVSVTWAKPPSRGDAEPPPKHSMVAAVEEDLQKGWRLQTLPHDYAGDDADAIYIPVKHDEVLRFSVATHGGLGSLLLTQTLVTLGVITFLILFVSAWAVRLVTAPLSSIASAARAFGRPGGGEADDIAENGPIEIAHAARALNEMRRRVRSLVDERTRMLVAVSHDLRTPLTRLRLRIERLRDHPAQAAMLEEIATINEMLSETLAYMREVGQTEAIAPTDLPSLLQTICGQFTDTGHDVVYRGPDRLVLTCRPHGLTRAVTNLVDNATKFGAAVEVGVTSRNGEVLIEVRDDGPGVPAAMLANVFEPFFKGDHARTQHGGGGFGLGLSIVREIAEGHGGGVEIENRRPRGLTARLRLPWAPTLEAA